MAFRPCWWLPNGHLQTCVASLTSRVHIPTKIELFSLTAEGDQLELCWLLPEQDNAKTPTLILLHGLEGSVNSPYIQGMLQQAQLLGWRAVVLHFRGSNGRVNALPQSYHAGKTEDLIIALNLIRQRYPASLCYAVGYSLGANVLLKFLGEHAEQNFIQKAVAVSPPFDLHASSTFVHQGINVLYERHFLKKLKYSISKKLEKGITLPVNLADLNLLNCFYDFDERITAPLHGFASAKDYYTRCSSKAFLGASKTPTLIIHAEDDPIIPRESIPQADQVSRSVQLEIYPKGGHVGFINGGRPGKLSYWLEQRIPLYLTLDHASPVRV